MIKGITKDKIIILIEKRYTIAKIANVFNCCKATIEKYLKKYNMKTKFLDESHVNYNMWSDEQIEAYVYILGFYLGDGTIYKTHRNRNKNNISLSCNLSFTNDKKYINMNNHIKNKLAIIFPNKNIKLHNNYFDNCSIISVTAIKLDKLFPYGLGRKHTRKIELLDWQWSFIEKYPFNFIKGVIESDGCRTIKKYKKNNIQYEYIQYDFSNNSLDIHTILHQVCNMTNIPFSFKEKQTGRLRTYFSKIEAVNLLETFIGKKS